MHVFVAMASGARGGGANHLLALLPALAKLGVRSTAWVGDDGPLCEQLRACGIDAHAKAMMGRRGDARLAFALMAAAKASGAALVHSHGTRAGVLCALGAALSRRPLPRVYSAHGLAHRAGRHPLSRGLRLGGEWLACARARALVSVSRADLEVLRALPGCGEMPAVHVPNGVIGSSSLAAARSDKDAKKAKRLARSRFNLPEHVPLVGTVSRLVAQKNVFALAEGVAQLRHTHLAVVGEGPDRAALCRHPLALAGRLHLLGPRDDVPAFLPALDVFALTSRWEGEPIALLEAMAHGLPWVATRTLGTEEIRGAAQVGTLVAQGDTAALACALQRLLADADRARREGEAGRHAVAARTPAQLARHMVAVYRDVLA